MDLYRAMSASSLLPKQHNATVGILTVIFASNQAQPKVPRTQTERITAVHSRLFDTCSFRTTGDG